MALARWQRTIVDNAGNILPGAQVTVRREVSGAPLAVLYSDRDGAVPLGNPFTADAVTAFAAFHAAGGAHRIDVVSGSFSQTLRYVAIGTAAERDLTLLGVADGVLRVDGDGVLRDSGVTISDGGVVSIAPSDPDVQNDAYAVARALRLQCELSTEGTASLHSANEFAMVITTDSLPTSSTVSYEKCAAIFIAATSDPSEYSPDITRDTVGLDMRGYINADNPLGRVWGGYSEGRIFAGGDGFVVGHEVFIVNEGIEQAVLGTVTGKYGLHCVSAGSNPATAALYISGGAGSWRHGLVIEEAGITNATDPIINLTSGNFLADRTGNLTLGAGLRVGFTGAPASPDRVEIGDGTHYLELASGTTPQWAVDTGDALQYNRSANAFVTVHGGVSAVVLSAVAVRPVVNDAVALGSSAEQFSDLFLAAGGEIRVNNVRVLGDRRPGWTAASGTATRTTFATGSVTTAQLAERVKALIDDLIAHGTIGA